MTETVLVTGASGFIASHITKRLLEDGYKVRGTVRSLDNVDKVSHLMALCEQAKDNLTLVEADLTKPETWTEAVKDCHFVMHTASPFPSALPVNADDIIVPAVEGTKAVLEACKEAKCVKRVVLTSSVAAVTSGTGDLSVEVSEEDWTNVDDKHCPVYYKSKTLAEKAAWEFVKELPEDNKFELVVINPGYVMGPLLSDNDCTSQEVVKRLLEKSMPMIPKVSFGAVDVRDVTEAHVKAMTSPDANGTRNILVNRNVWFTELAEILDNEFKPKGYHIARSVAPKFVVWMSSLFDKSIKLILPMYGKEIKINNTKTNERLNLEYRPMEETVIDMANSMIERNLIKKPKVKSSTSSFSLKKSKSKPADANEATTDDETGTAASATTVATNGTTEDHAVVNGVADDDTVKENDEPQVNGHTEDDKKDVVEKIEEKVNDEPIAVVDVDDDDLKKDIHKIEESVVKTPEPITAAT